MYRLKAKNDFVFQRIFGRQENKEILISFLNAVLMLENESKLNDIDVMENTKLEKDRPEDKLGILDIKARTVSGVQINIEIQIVNQYNMDKRTLFYWSKLFTEQLNEGQAFNELKKTITINILDFEYIKVENYHSVFHLWEDSRKDYKLTDVLEIRFIELPKFRKIQPDMSKPIDRWLLFLEDSPKEVLDMAIKAEPAIEKAQKVLEYLGTNEEIRRYYELREKAIHDEITRLTGAKEEGIKQGIQQGIQQGEHKKGFEVARNMLLDGIEDTIIEKYTGISKDDLEKLKNNT